MRKRVLTVCISCLIILLTFNMDMCKTDIEDHGIDEYHYASSSVGLTRELLPYEKNEEDDEEKYYGFLTKYKYIDGDYRYTYKDDGWLYHTRETVLIWLRYEPEVYEEAKAYMLETVPLSEKYRYEYNGYCFIANLRVDPLSQEDGDYIEFPEPLLMVCYNDAKNILLFNGLYTTGKQAELRKEILDSSDWGAFLKEYYPFYNFDA